MRSGESGLKSTVYVDFVVTDFLGGLQKTVHDRRLRPEVLDAQVTSRAVVLGARQPRYPHVLGLDEVRQHVLVTPALVSGVLPRVIVLPVAPDVEHGVQHAAAPDDFAAGPVGLVAVEAQARRLAGLGFVLPVDGCALQGRIQYRYV